MTRALGSHNPPHLDVSKVPEHAMDARAPLWWGNLLMILIETTTVVLLLASYFYIRRNYEHWPPPRVDRDPPMLHTQPYLGAATVNMLLMVLSCLPMYWTDMAARRKDRRKVVIGLLFMTVVALATCGIRWLEFKAVHFKWNENAYASVVWTLLGLHLIYLIGAALEFAIMLAWIVLRGIDEKHALDVTLAGGYWYWTAGTWVVAYLVVFWSPRWM